MTDNEAKGELTHWVLCWRVERRDGVTIGLIAHDRDVVLDGLLYRASPGMRPSAVVRSEGLKAATMDVTGAITADAIREDDLVAGRWEGARVSVFAIDWRDSSRPVALGEGTVGAVEIDDSGFTAELVGVAAALERPVAEETSPECRAELGDRRCRVGMAGRRRFARVLTAEGAVVTLDADEPVVNAYGGGRLRWFGGEGCGSTSQILRSDEARMTLGSAAVASPGTLVEITEGCDKSIATCAARFGNAVNFRGEPFLPGIDLLTRYSAA